MIDADLTAATRSSSALIEDLLASGYTLIKARSRSVRLACPCLQGIHKAWIDFTLDEKGAASIRQQVVDRGHSITTTMNDARGE